MKPSSQAVPKSQGRCPSLKIGSSLAWCNDLLPHHSQRTRSTSAPAGLDTAPSPAARLQTRCRIPPSVAADGVALSVPFSPTAARPGRHPQSTGVEFPQERHMLRWAAESLLSAFEVYGGQPCRAITAATSSAATTASPGATREGPTTAATSRCSTEKISSAPAVETPSVSRRVMILWLLAPGPYWYSRRAAVAAIGHTSNFPALQRLEWRLSNRGGSAWIYGDREGEGRRTHGFTWTLPQREPLRVSPSV